MERSSLETTPQKSYHELRKTKLEAYNEISSITGYDQIPDPIDEDFYKKYIQNIRRSVEIMSRIRELCNEQKNMLNSANPDEQRLIEVLDIELGRIEALSSRSRADGMAQQYWNRSA